MSAAYLAERGEFGGVDAARLATGRLVEADDVGDIRLPDIGDLASRLRFSLRDGRVWLDTQRVAVIHLSTLASLRRELTDKLGVREARGFLTRMGYASGFRDAALARKLRPHHTVRDAFLVGPQLRVLQGVLLMEPVRLEIDIPSGHFHGEFTWPESYEVDAHISSYGVSAVPVCWMQTGYASGYTSSFMGRTVLYREVECLAAGARRCRIVGKPLEAWDKDCVDDDLRALQPERFANQFAARRRAPLSAGSPLPEDVVTDLVGASSGFVAACHMLQKVAKTEATVLFLGETGVGKEMFAQTLHRVSRRADKPFVAVNCAAIPENLIESELFGVERGAFTGAVQSRPGRFERANGGTLFLDEVGNLTLTAQVKLLRAIQQKEIERVGDTHPRKVDVRIIAATNVNLEEAVHSGAFREDLLFRLKVFPLRIPPLRERRDDIPLLLDHFLHKFVHAHGRNVTGLTPRAMDALYDYDYPGNIRELENLVERAVILAEDGQPIDLVHLFTFEEKVSPVSMLRLGRSGELQAPDQPQPETSSSEDLVGRLLASGMSLEDMETRMMKEALEHAGGNLSWAARMLGMTRPQLAYRLKKQTRGDGEALG